MSLVVLKPTAKRVFGDKTYAGEYKDKAGNMILDAKIQPLIINGNGMALDLETEIGATIYKAITECPKLIPFFSKGASQQFEIVNEEEKAEQYLKERSSREELGDYIKQLTGTKLKSFGRIFGFVGTDAVVKAGLLRMSDGTKAEREQLAKIVYHPDKVIVELIFAGLAEGDLANRKGLYKNGAGLYFYNDMTLGLGQDATIAFLKNPDNAGIYDALKNAYLGSLKE